MALKVSFREQMHSNSSWCIAIAIYNCQSLKKIPKGPPRGDQNGSNSWMTFLIHLPRPRDSVSNFSPKNGLFFGVFFCAELSDPTGGFRYILGRLWLQTFCIFTTTWKRSNLTCAYFSNGWFNHQVEYFLPEKVWFWRKFCCHASRSGVEKAPSWGLWLQPFRQSCCWLPFAKAGGGVGSFFCVVDFF